MSKSAEEILEEKYEEVFASQKYNKSNLFYTYRDVVLAAMESYALPPSKEQPAMDTEGQKGMGC